MASAFGNKMEKHYWRMDYTLGCDLYCGITAFNWILDLRYYSRICLRSTRGMAHPSFSYCCRVNFLLLCITDDLAKIRGTPGCERQALCSPNVDVEARWPKVTGHDPPLSVTILAFKRGHVHVSECASGDVRSRNGDHNSKAPSSCLHWQPTCSYSEEWGEDERGYSGN